MHKLFHHIFTKWPLAAILVFPICSKIDRVLPLQVINGCVNYEFDTCIWCRSYVKHKLFHHIFTKWSLAAILVFRFSPKSIGFFHSRSSMAVSNMNLIRALVSQLRETQALACGGGGGMRRRRRRPDQNHNIPEILNFGDIIKEAKIAKCYFTHMTLLCPGPLV